MSFIVTEKAERPLGKPGRCFYCHREIGEPHEETCTLVRKKVLVRLTVDYEVVVAAGSTKEEVEFHRNDSSWCMSNAINELQELFGDKGKDCLCPHATFEWLGNESEPYLDED